MTQPEDNLLHFKSVCVFFSFYFFATRVS